MPTKKPKKGAGAHAQGGLAELTITEDMVGQTVPLARESVSTPVKRNTKTKGSKKPIATGARASGATPDKSGIHTPGQLLPNQLQAQAYAGLGNFFSCMRVLGVNIKGIREVFNTYIDETALLT